MPDGRRDPAVPRRQRLLLGIAALALSAAALLGAWWLHAPSATAVALQVAPLVRTLQFSARVAAASRVDLGSTLTGRVLQVAAIEGAQVRQGEVLLRLESDELRAALGQALASETLARARLDGLRSTGRRSAQAGVAQATPVLVTARAELERTQELVAQGFLSEARLDQAHSAVAVAQAQQAGAQAQRAANADAGTDVAQARAQLALAAATTAGARARLGQMVLSAPADARVLARLVEPGQIVQPGHALLTLALAGPPQLSAQADERFLQQLQVGQRASVLADAFPGQRFAAQVLSIAPLVDAQRGAVEVKFSLTPPVPAFLREDMTLSVEVETARLDAALVMPVAALRSDDARAGTTVLVERGGRVERRAVRLGLRTLEAAQVLDGLVAGDRLLIGAAPAPGHRVRAELAAGAASAALPGREAAGSAMRSDAER